MTKFRTVCDDCVESWDCTTISQAIQIKSIHDAIHYDIHNTRVVDYS
jgi:hypothetical protein